MEELRIRQIVKRREAKNHAPRATVETLWADGRTAAEIGRILGWSRAPSSYISRLRQQGYDLPLRNKGRSIAATRDNSTKLHDLIGERFGRLMVVARAVSSSGRATRWVCSCDCGREHTVLATNLVSGRTTSCGCLRRVRPDPKELDLAWAAGFVDGEGCIGIIARGGTYFVPQIDVDNTYEDALRAMKNVFTVGTIGCVVRKAPQKDCYKWRVSSASAITVARLLLPYLRVKRRQAEMLIAFQDEALWTKGTGAGTCVPDDEWQRRQELYTDIRALNRRGR